MRALVVLLALSAGGCKAQETQWPEIFGGDESYDRVSSELSLPTHHVGELCAQLLGAEPCTKVADSETRAFGHLDEWTRARSQMRDCMARTRCSLDEEVVGRALDTALTLQHLARAMYLDLCAIEREYVTKMGPIAPDLHEFGTTEAESNLEKLAVARSEYLTLWATATMAASDYGPLSGSSAAATPNIHQILEDARAQAERMSCRPPTEFADSREAPPPLAAEVLAVMSRKPPPPPEPPPSRVGYPLVFPGLSAPGHWDIRTAILKFPFHAIGGLDYAVGSARPQIGIPGFSRSTCLYHALSSFGGVRLFNVVRLGGRVEFESSLLTGAGGSMKGSTEGGAGFVGLNLPAYWPWFNVVVDGSLGSRTLHGIVPLEGIDEEPVPRTFAFGPFLVAGLETRIGLFQDIIGIGYRFTNVSTTRSTRWGAFDLSNQTGTVLRAHQFSLMLNVAPLIDFLFAIPQALWYSPKRL